MYKKLYFFNDLEDEAKEKAREWYRNGNSDSPFLSDYLHEITSEMLTEAGYTVEDLEMFYSLSYCQGDGVSFSATLEKGNARYFVSKYAFFGRDVHEMSMNVEGEDLTTFESIECDDILEEMREIARKVEKLGYEYIENENSDETVDDNINVNEYTFTREGIRIDADID